MPLDNIAQKVLQLVEGEVEPLENAYDSDAGIHNASDAITVNFISLEQ